MLNFDKYTLKTFRHSSSQKSLSKQELNDWKRFLFWFNTNLENKNLCLFYRGTTKSDFKERVNPLYSSNQNDYWMKYIFEWGEKSKSFLKQNENNTALVQSIEDISEETFNFIFSKINEILTKKDHPRVIHFKKQNQTFCNYFNQSSKKTVFLKTILSLDKEDKLKIRNYYLKLIHSIFDFGHKNENSIFVSCTESLSRASTFSQNNNKTKNNIILLYWLAKPLKRFGLSISIITKFAELVGSHNLPMYFSEFYPEDEEFCAIGALFPGHIIGYIDGSDFIINSDFLEENLELDDERLSKGFQLLTKDEQKAELYKKSLHSKQVTLWGNETYTDRKL